MSGNQKNDGLYNKTFPLLDSDQLGIRRNAFRQVQRYWKAQGKSFRDKFVELVGGATDRDSNIKQRLPERKQLLREYVHTNAINTSRNDLIEAHNDRLKTQIAEFTVRAGLWKTVAANIFRVAGGAPLPESPGIILTTIRIATLPIFLTAKGFTTHRYCENGLRRGLSSAGYFGLAAIVAVGYDMGGALLLEQATNLLHPVSSAKTELQHVSEASRQGRHHFYMRLSSADSTSQRIKFTIGRNKNKSVVVQHGAQNKQHTLG